MAMAGDDDGALDCTRHPGRAPATGRHRRRPATTSYTTIRAQLRHVDGNFGKPASPPALLPLSLATAISIRLALAARLPSLATLRTTLLVQRRRQQQIQKHPQQDDHPAREKRSMKRKHADQISDSSSGPSSPAIFSPLPLHMNAQGSEWLLAQSSPRATAALATHRDVRSGGAARRAADRRTELVSQPLVVLTGTHRSELQKHVPSVSSFPRPARDRRLALALAAACGCCMHN